MPLELPCEPVAPDRRSAAELAVKHAAYLDSLPAVEKALSNCGAAHSVGLDTEFVRERTFHARPGLVQLSDGQQVWLIDAVAVASSEALGEFLQQAGIIKVLHSVGEDLEILHAVGGRWPTPLFDTQVAAALLGMPLQIRYEHLVKAALDVDLVGGKARNDWCRRPLAPELLHYAAEDVIWLPRLKERLETLLERAGRLAWHREDCARIVERARAGDSTPPLARVKGAGRLETDDLARLDALARWREAAAREKDLPRRFVVGDETLIDLARGAREGRLGQALGKLPPAQQRRFGAAIEQAVSEAQPERYTRPEWLDPITPEQRDRLREAQNAVKAIAEELQVEPALIASKRELTRLIRGERPDWLNGWRGQILAGRLESASVSISAP